MSPSHVTRSLDSVGKAVVRDTGDSENTAPQKTRRGQRISKNINQVHKERLTIGQKLADRLADVAGSWAFIIAYLSAMGVWIVINSIVLVNRAIDPYPFILLNLVLSGLAGMQAPVIMMSQNRQEAKDRLRAEHDYEVNLKAEIEIEQLHTKLDLLREDQWKELVEMELRQIALLEKQIQMLQSILPGQTK
ncbi:MAG: DUF1003 domain-containing protein [Dehalococcoidia bacterium]|nr:DUF1003 domain-containing protein [Dehalococcoidia bacterium]